jgi:hypothetical protein
MNGTAGIGKTGFQFHQKPDAEVIYSTFQYNPEHHSFVMLTTS